MVAPIRICHVLWWVLPHCTAPLHLLSTLRNSWCLYLLAAPHAAAADMGVQIARISEPLLSSSFFLFLLLLQLQGYRVRFCLPFYYVFPLSYIHLSFPTVLVLFLEKQSMSSVSLNAENSFVLL